jgi:hypothetical protein
MAHALFMLDKKDCRHTLKYVILIALHAPKCSVYKYIAREFEKPQSTNPQKASVLNLDFYHKIVDMWEQGADQRRIKSTHKIIISVREAENQ